MKKPFKKSLIDDNQSSMHSSLIHPNPLFYKYYWQIFTLKSEFEGNDFFNKTASMSTAACMKAMHDLDEAGELYMVYNHHKPRRFEGMPFNPNSEKWRNQEWAPAFEDDQDPEWNGFK